MLDIADGHGLGRLDHECMPRLVQLARPAIRAVVVHMAMAHAFEELRVIAIHAFHQAQKLFFLAHERRVARQDHDMLARSAERHGKAQGHAVAGAAVEQLLAVHLHDLGHERHAAGRLQVIDICHGFDAVVVGLPGLDVARHGIEVHGRRFECGHVERIGLEDAFEDEAVAEHRAVTREVIEGQVARIGAVFDVDEAGAPDFAGQIVVAVERSGARADDVFAPDVVIHEEIEHARRELAAHRAAFKDEVRARELLAGVCRRGVADGFR